MWVHMKLIVEWFDVEFPDEEACISFFQNQKWPDGFRCAACGHQEAYVIRTRSQPLYECMNCRRQSTLTSNTIMHKSRTPLRKWLLSIYLISNISHSINAVQLSSVISVTYKTAWAILHKIRSVISTIDDSVLLRGEIEGKHEIFMKKMFPSDSQLQKEKSVIVAKSSDRKNGEYYKIKIVDRDYSARQRLTEKEQNDFFRHHMELSASLIHWNPRFQRKYSSQSLRFSSECCTHKNSYHVFSKPDHLSEIAASAFQWMNDIFHGIGVKYAQQYLDEHCFRLNYLWSGCSGGFEKLCGCMMKAVVRAPKIKKALLSAAA